ncbi:ankyrin repeat domain-containing protein 65-like [Schistocerca nitens]|uniref:ankyrin repeat domain-containing protein 65-like n=1 Tax=Schistocerca nitens TaxID=7011 RepID=UPI0021180D3D|nr:ankyrin repeat domain-containing protein 65-like [Schistocerca nitens]
MLSHGASLCSAPPTGGSRRTASTRTPPRKDRDRRTRPPCDATISRLRRLSKQERGRMLIEAAVVGAVEMIRMLLVAGVDVQARDNCGMTALHRAAVAGHVEAVRCLLRNGAEVGSEDSERRTPLHLAATAGHAAVVRLLMVPTAGSDAGCRYRGMPLRANAGGLADTGAVPHRAGNYRRVQN